jgi:hypothetical protein
VARLQCRTNQYSVRRLEEAISKQLSAIRMK